jgi:hypothetical protein
VLECLVNVSMLELGHAYKDKVAKGQEATAGLFNYPMLMAADIILYDTDVVPVGADQKQHVEYAREAAAKFNQAYGQTFKEPKGNDPRDRGGRPRHRRQEDEQELRQHHPALWHQRRNSESCDEHSYRLKRRSGPRKTSTRSTSCIGLSTKVSFDKTLLATPAMQREV